MHNAFVFYVLLYVGLLMVVITGDTFSWLRDEEFCRQTLAGLNPYSIQLVTVYSSNTNLLWLNYETNDGFYLLIVDKTDYISYLQAFYNKLHGNIGVIMIK